jgi:hypothetical protein
MRTLSGVLALLVLSEVTAAEIGNWTLYYSDLRNFNGDGSGTITPTLSVVGDDGGWCSAYDQNFGVETPALMLNGNKWVLGDSIQSGQVDIGGQTINFAYTFPNVSISAGQTVDMSYAAKVHGVCYGNHNGAFPPFTMNAFFGDTFVDGTAPPVFPSPCYIVTGSPSCPLPWPPLWQTVPSPGRQQDLDSQKVPVGIRFSVTFWGPSPIVTKGPSGEIHCTYNVLACSTGTPTCKSATPALALVPGCPSYVKADYAVWDGTCEFGIVQTASGPGPCT